MDTLPLELHSQIFEYACVDDGTTARSLSLVSRYIRAVAEPFRYQSLSVAGIDSLLQLARTLEELPAHRRRVRHLFLSDWTQKQVREKVVPSGDGDMDRYDLEKATVLRILDLVAPTLRTFSFVAACPFNSTSLIGYLYSLHLPHLQELAVNGFYPYPHAPECMPRLEKLHLSGNRNPHGLLQSGGLATACPKLRDLHIGGLVSAASFAEELQCALVAGARDAATPLPPRTIPSSLQRVFLRVGPMPSHARRYASARMQHEKMLEILRSMVSLPDSSRGVELEVVEVEGGENVYELLKTCSAGS